MSATWRERRVGLTASPCPFSLSPAVSVGFEGLQDLARLGPAPQFLLREKRPTPGDNFEYPTGGGDQTQCGNLAILCLEDFFRHTDGVGEIPSARAVLDRDLNAAGHRQ